MEKSNELKAEAIRGYNQEKAILVGALTASDSNGSGRQQRIQERLEKIDEMIKELTNEKHLVLPPAMAYEVQKMADVKDIL